MPLFQCCCRSETHYLGNFCNFSIINRFTFGSCYSLVTCLYTTTTQQSNLFLSLSLSLCLCVCVSVCLSGSLSVAPRRLQGTNQSELLLFGRPPLLTLHTQPSLPPVTNTSLQLHHVIDGRDRGRAEKRVLAGSQTVYLAVWLDYWLSSWLSGSLVIWLMVV